MNNEPILEKRDLALRLFEIYGKLLTDSQKEVFSDYYVYDLSLAEIAENRNISRAAVSESLNKSLAKLEEYESKLSFSSYHEELIKALEAKDDDRLEELIRNGI